MVVSATPFEISHFHGSGSSHVNGRVTIRILLLLPIFPSSPSLSLSLPLYPSRGDIQYISRLLRLSYNFVPKCCTTTGSSLDTDSQFLHGKLCLLPFDKFVDPLTGEEDDNRTTFVSIIMYIHSNPSSLSPRLSSLSLYLMNIH